MNDYEDIIELERPKSRKHLPMPIADRAAQFSPFAALTGFDDCIAEATEKNRTTEDASRHP